MSLFGGNWETILIATCVATATALGGGLSTRLGTWYRDLRKPSWQPPEWLFGPAWTTIFAFATAAAVIGWESAPTRGAADWMVALFGVNVVLNVLWSILFFTLKRPDWALIEVAFLFLSIAAIMLAMQPYAGLASLLLLPYLLWVGFASFLNWTIVRLNAPFGVRMEYR